MLDIKNYIRRNFAQRNLSEALISNIAMKTIQNHLNIGGTFKIYMKNNIIFIKNESFIGNAIFLQKKKLIELINDKLKTFGYRRNILDIIIK